MRKSTEEYVQYNTFSIKLKPTKTKIHTLQNTFRRELFFKVNEKQVKDKYSMQDNYYLGLEGIREMKEEDPIGRRILPKVLVFILNR